jgi:flagellar motor switch protein FliG
LLVILGEDAASQIYRNLPPADVEQITREIAALSAVDAETALATLEEFERLVIAGDYLAQGGKDYANKLLIKAFGEEGAKELLHQVSLTAEMSAGKLDSLRKADPQQLAKFIEGEHPQTVALILAHLEAKQASTLVMRLPEELRAEAIKRLAQLRQFSPEMAERVSLVLHKRLEALGEQSRRAYAGLRAVADVMNRLEINTAKTILEGIEKEDPKLAISIRNLMFTFEDLLTVPEVGIRELLGQLDKKTLATALRGASEELKSYIFKSMSSRAVEMLKEDMDVLGPVRSREIQKAQMEAVAVARKLEAEGKIVLTPEEMMSTSPSRALEKPAVCLLTVDAFPYDSVSETAVRDTSLNSAGTSEATEAAFRETQAHGRGLREGKAEAQKKFEEQLARERSALAAALAQFTRDRAAYFQKVEREVGIGVDRLQLLAQRLDGNFFGVIDFVYN